MELRELPGDAGAAGPQHPGGLVQRLVQPMGRLEPHEGLGAARAGPPGSGGAPPGGPAGSPGKGGAPPAGPTPPGRRREPRGPGPRARGSRPPPRPRPAARRGRRATGIPASDTSATVSPRPSRSRSSVTRDSSRGPGQETRRAGSPKRAASLAVTRVSSQKIASASESARRARGERSSRLPMGVPTTSRRPLFSV